MTMSIIYITAGTRDEARAIAEALIAERLIACANILGDMESIYRWQGAIERENEIAMIVKTRKDLVGKTIARITDLHSYTTPCAIELAIGAGNPDYLAWLAEETSGT